MVQKYRARDVLVGLFVVAGVVAVVIGIFWIRGVGVGATHEYLVRYENVGTISVGSAVKYHGLLVGRVRALDIDPDVAERIRATLDVDSEVPVTTRTIAQVQKSDLLGDEYIELMPAEAEAGTAAALRIEGEPLPPGTYLQAGEPFDLGAAMRSAQGTIEELGDIVALLREDGQAVFDSVEGALADTRDLLSPENRATVARTLQHFEATAASTRSLVDDMRPRVEGALTDAETAVAHLRDLAAQADEMVGELRPEIKDAIASLRATADRAESTLASLQDAVDDLDMRQANMLLENLETTTRNLNELTRDLKERPYLLLRPQKPDVKGLPR